ncbi:cytochrome P450 2C20-like isoform X4 [Anguilla rostrata]|uniref:cytochrome P450 2C20-like isoform X4 n=1 Tax=Anguilla rostrata TaxID=7938 RepID=UPI0030D2D719
MEFLSTLVLVGLMVVLLAYLSWKGRKGIRLPPGPTPLPLLGNLLQLDKKAPFKTFMKLSETYGPVLTVYLGPQRTVVLVGFNTVKEALLDQADDFTGRAPLPFLNRVVKGYGLAISNGERWRQLRRFTLSTLRDFGMGRKRMEEWIQEESRHLVDSLSSTKSTPCDPTFFLSRAVSNVICALVFGHRFDYQDDSFLHLLKTFSVAVRFGSSPWGQLYNVFPRLMEFLPGKQHSIFAGLDNLRVFVKERIQKHKDTLCHECPRDFIDCYLIRQNKEKDSPTSEFNYDNMVGTVLNLFLAGTETTSTTLRYSIMMLIKYPQIQERIQLEIDTVIGRERLPLMEDRKSLPFTDAVIHEVQRVLDIVPLNIPHYATHDISFKGYTIPKDTVIIPMLHSVLRDEQQWETPWSFNPGHFLDQNDNFRKSPAFMPFSAGKRSCVLCVTCTGKQSCVSCVTCTGKRSCVSCVTCTGKRSCVLCVTCTGKQSCVSCVTCTGKQSCVSCVTCTGKQSCVSCVTCTGKQSCVSCVTCTGKQSSVCRVLPVQVRGAVCRVLPVQVSGAVCRVLPVQVSGAVWASPWLGWSSSSSWWPCCSASPLPAQVGPTAWTPPPRSAVSPAFLGRTSSSLPPAERVQYCNAFPFQKPGKRFSYTAQIQLIM